VNLNVNLKEFFAATPDEVWESLTDREVLADWLMPNDFVAEVGTTFTLVPDHPAPWKGDVECEVLQLLPRKKMVWSWKTLGMQEATRVEFELIPKKGGTELVFKHGGDADEPVAKGLKGGWPDMFDRLTVTVGKRGRLTEQNKRVVRVLPAGVRRPRLRSPVGGRAPRWALPLAETGKSSCRAPAGIVDTEDQAPVDGRDRTLRRSRRGPAFSGSCKGDGIVPGHPLRGGRLDLLVVT
jgi:uncharacterized protein YndB with AHSA1/START domain